MAELRFGKKKRRINYDLIRKILVWILEIVSVCILAFVLVWCFRQLGL